MHRQIVISGSRILGLFGFSVTSIVNSVLKALTSWVASGARAVVGSFGHVLSASTTVSFGSGFMVEFNVLRSFGAILAAAFLCVAIIQAVLQQNSSMLLRVVFIRLPISLLFSGIGIEIVTMLLHATDALTAALLQTSARPGATLVAGISAILVGNAVVSPALAGFEGLAFSLILAVVAFVCWLELVVRAAAISIATLFIPLALAGTVWPATQQWIRRLAETLFALIMSKVVVAGVFALAVISMGTAQGVNMLVEGIALFVLCAWAPFSVLHLLPFVEAGAVGHLEALGQRSGQALRHLSSSVGPLVGDYLSPAPSPGVEEVDGIPWAPGDPGVRIEVDQEDAEFFKFLGPYVKVREPSASGQKNGPYPGTPPSITRVNPDREQD